MAYELPKLGYPYDALEPHIDARTMEIHHTKHHNGYVTKVNDALKGTDMEGKPIEEVIQHLDKLPEGKQTAVRNNGGGHINHTLFWDILGPNAGGAPGGELGDAITQSFGSYDDFKAQFADAAATRFGSGWAWLCKGPSGIHICSTANQDNPMMPEAFGGHGQGHTPILGIDVWEHAYYLNYQNKRPDYIAAFFNVVDWNKVAARYAKA